MEDKIIIKGARVHNLKNINLELPKNKIIVFTGVSGSGKSSLAFDTIFAEGQRRYIESLSPYARQFLGQMDKPDVDEISGLSPAIAIDQKALSHNPRSTVGTLTEIYDYLRVLYARLGEVFCPLCGTRIQKLSLDEMVDIILAQAKLRQAKYVVVLAPVVRGRKGEYYQLLYDYLSQGFGEARIDGKKYSLHDKIELSRYQNHDIDIVMDKVLVTDESRLFEAVENATHYSKGLVTVVFNQDIGLKISPEDEILLSSQWTCPKDNFAFPEVEPRLFSFNSPYGACPVCHGLGKEDIFSQNICVTCHGARLRPEALAVKIHNTNIYQLTTLSIDKAYQFFLTYEDELDERQKTIANPLIKALKERLGFLINVGLDYLTLNREAETLSGGEAQRIRLASQIGSQLADTLYVLDEPTIGLHERDTEKLIQTLKLLQERHNTVIIVEHDERTILSSDYLVDLGPGAGTQGGEVVVAGPTKELIQNEKKYSSLTLDYLRGKREIKLPTYRRTKMTEKLQIIGARANNLKNIQVEIPLRKLAVVTGVSGSGKSSLVYDVLYKNLVKIMNRSFRELNQVSKILGSEYLDRVVMVDQSPIGRTPRSNPATYTGIFTPIRDFYASLPEAREKAYSASRFSFNVPASRGGGRCEACEGAGYKLIEMHFLAPVLVECEVCHGKRFNRETLEVKYQNKNISDVLNLTISDALKFFEGIYTITDKLKVLEEV
ncbi:MAG: excinuclease subunit, partial [Patescibacteria group bacterium]|nr:excinuclease subunit [Patescibacteria group bacterium]